MKPFIGHWHIVGTGCFDCGYIDLCGESYLTVPRESFGEMSFGALLADLDFSVSPGMLFFDWHGSEDKMDEYTGHGSMELICADEAEIEIEFSNGDAAVLKIVRGTDG